MSKLQQINKMKNALITGIGHGIGEATAKKFLVEGWSVVGTSTSGSVNISNKNLLVYRLDLSDENSIRDFTQSIKLLEKKIDVLINNAGINSNIDKEKIDIIDFRKTLDVNLIGTISLTETLLDYFASGSSIVNISSSAGLISSAMKIQMTAYRISKAGINMYTHTLAQRLISQKIVVSAYNPGFVRTRLNGNQGTKEPEKAAEEIFTLATTNKESGYFWDENKRRDI
jgi:NAD(P)-dependent dehydrogenase (short-subunit alcohol dehydrogenase family)